MIVLTGNNLGARHQQLNAKVNEAYKNKDDYQNIKSQVETSDVDKLFKIKLASKYKDIDYIIEVLKSGDSFHIATALKLGWIYNDEFINYINPNYLENEVFPLMSKKMKTVMLLTIAKHVRNESRAIDFYNNYKDANFLFHTSESFKINLVQTAKDEIRYARNRKAKNDFVKNFIGNSFDIADAYFKLGYGDDLRYVTYLYSVSQEKYLDLIEKYLDPNENYRYHPEKRFGYKISKSILTKQKEMVLRKKPFLYAMLNASAIKKYFTLSDAKLFAASLLPDEVGSFWHPYLFLNKELINLIPIEERFRFIKQIFSEKYPNAPFEMSKEFYDCKGYELMTLEEQESWALKHLETDDELLGEGMEYQWYEFINFETAFSSIKKLIHKTSGRDRRLEMLKVLAKKANAQREIENLLEYYYSRHRNESFYETRSFLECFISKGILNFDDGCWTAFSKLCKFNSLLYDEYRIVALMYYLVHNKDPEELKPYLDHGICVMELLRQFEDIPNLTDDRKELIFQYVMQYYVNILENIYGRPYEEIENKVTAYVKILCTLIRKHKKSYDYPEIVLKYMEMDPERFENFKPIISVEEPVSVTELLKCLKKDATKVVDKIPNLNELLHEHHNGMIGMRRFYRKIKVYFSNDVVPEYLKFFETLLLKPYSVTKYLYSVSSGIFGIFNLADERTKVDLMVECAPKGSEMETLDELLEEKQKGICRSFRVSRPPVPLQNVLPYLQGDYLLYSLATFNVYFSNLPLNLLMKFIEATLDKPISIQKHAIRLAFKCFEKNKLIELCFKVWSSTKNVTLRRLIYLEVWRKFSRATDEETGREFLHVLKIYTSSLNSDDDDKVFKVFDRLPYMRQKKLLGEYLEVAWYSINKLPDKRRNNRRKLYLIDVFTRYLSYINDNCIKSIIEDHIRSILVEKNIQISNDDENVCSKKWNLVALYIVHSNAENYQTSLSFIQMILDACLKEWNYELDGIYVYKQFLLQFIQNFKRHHDLSFSNLSFPYLLKIFELLLKFLEEKFLISEMHLILWKLRFSILNFNLILDENFQSSDVYAVEYGKRVSNMIKEFADKKLYSICFSSEIGDMLFQNFHLGDKFILKVALELISNKTLETYLLALRILPQECPDANDHESNEIYKNIIVEMKAFENNEFQFSLYRKFVTSDFKRRRLF